MQAGVHSLCDLQLLFQVCVVWQMFAPPPAPRPRPRPAQPPSPSVSWSIGWPTFLLDRGWSLGCISSDLSLITHKAFLLLDLSYLPLALAEALVADTSPWLPWLISCHAGRKRRPDIYPRDFGGKV